MLDSWRVWVLEEHMGENVRFLYPLVAGYGLRDILFLMETIFRKDKRFHDIFTID